MQAPLVSVAIIAYNHAGYIRQCIDSVMSQKTTFPFEVIIGDDCSTDGTREILLTYRQQYPDKIKLLLHEKNMGFLGKKNHIDILIHCTGKYIAQLDGDDYWCNDEKLNTQVEFLELHSEFSICFHKAKWYVQDQPDLNREYPAGQEAITDSYTLAKEGNYIPTSSILFRNKFDFNNMPQWIFDNIVGDWAFNMLMGEGGKFYFIDKVWSVYRVHNQGHWTQMKTLQHYENAIRTKDYINKQFHNKYKAELDEQVMHMYFYLLNSYTEQKKRKEALQIWHYILLHYHKHAQFKFMLVNLLVNLGARKIHVP